MIGGLRRGQGSLLHGLGGEWKAIVWTAEAGCCGAESLEGEVSQQEEGCEKIHGEIVVWCLVFVFGVALGGRMTGVVEFG